VCLERHEERVHGGVLPHPSYDGIHICVNLCAEGDEGRPGGDRSRREYAPQGRERRAYRVVPADEDVRPQQCAQSPSRVRSPRHPQVGKECEFFGIEPEGGVASEQGRDTKKSEDRGRQIDILKRV
jgi:hypothetical protein